MIALALVCCLLAVALLGWVMLPYDTEEKVADDILVKWWVAADDASKSRRSETITLAIASWFTDMFGPRVFAPRALAISFCLSTSSIVLFLSLGAAAFWQVAAGEANIVAVVISAVTAIGGLSISIACYSAAISIARRRKLSSFVLEYAAISAGLLILVLFARPAIAYGIAKFILGWLLCGAVAHYVAIAVARSLFSWASGRSGVVHILAASATYALLGVCLFVLPFVGIASRPNGPWLAPLFFVGASSLFTLAGGLGTLAASVTLLLSRTFWPIFARILYNTHRFGILRRRKLLFYAATGLLGVGAPTFAKYLMNGAGPFLK